MGKSGTTTQGKYTLQWSTQWDYVQPGQDVAITLRISGLSNQGMYSVGMTVEEAGGTGEAEEMAALLTTGSALGTGLNYQRALGVAYAVYESVKFQIRLYDRSTVVPLLLATFAPGDLSDVLIYVAEDVMPKIESFQAERCSSAGVLQDDGQYVRVRIAMACAQGMRLESADHTLRVGYRVEGSTGAYTYQTLSIPTQQTMLSVGAVFAVTKRYELICELYNPYAKASAYTSIPIARTNLHLAGTGYGVGIGQYSTGTEANPQFDCQYPAHFYSGLQVDGEVRGLARDTITAHLTGYVTAVICGTDPAAQKIIPFDEATCQIGTGLTLRSDGGILVGEGVQYVRASLSVFFSDGFTAGRNVHTAIRKGSALADGWVRGRFLTPAANPYTTYTIAPTVFAVQQGDVIYGTFGAQNGNAGRIADGSWITVEAVG